MQVRVETEGLNLNKRLTNDTGVPLLQNDLFIIGIPAGGAWVAIAMENIAAGAVGPFQNGDGIEVQISDLKAGEDTFATQGQRVFIDPVTGEASDTATVGYYEIGKLTEVKNSAGVIRMETLAYANLIESDET